MKKSKSVLALCLFASVASLTTLLTGCKIHDSVNPYGYAEFNLSAGEGGSAAVIRGEKIVYHIGDEVTIEAKADEHYKFAGWVDMLSNDKNAILSYDLTYTFKLAETNDIEAVFYVKTNLPIYTHIPTDMGDLENYYGSAEEGDYNWLNLGVVSMDHWTFGGWFLDAEYSKELNAENLKALLEGENAPSRIDIYAQLTHNTEEVNFIFYAVDGTKADVIENVVNPNQGPFYEGDNLELQDPSKANDETYAYEFEGWYTDADLSVKFESITLSEAVTIYGKFLKSNITTHTVIWKVDGEIVETDTAIPYNNAPLYDGTEPAKTSDAQYSYEFAGWKIENTEDSALVTLAD